MLRASAWDPKFLERISKTWTAWKNPRQRK